MPASAALLVFFFFSSRRRHTRFKCDWSSDVCSSDLGRPIYTAPSHTRTLAFRPSGGSIRPQGREELTGMRRLNRRNIMARPDYSMRQLLEAGVHFGHQAHRWNPKMAEYIFGVRNNIHIIDLAQSVPMLHRALQAVSDTVAKGGRILFVGTKRHAQDAVADAAKRCPQ